MEKYFEQTKEKLEFLKNSAEYLVKTTGMIFTNSVLSLNKITNEYEFETKVKLPLSFNKDEIFDSNNDEIVVSKDDKDYVIPKGGLITTGLHTNSESLEERKITGEITQLFSDTPSKFDNTFIREMIPIDKTFRIWDLFELDSFNIGKTFYRSLVEITISQNIFHFYVLPHKGAEKWYFVIEAQASLTFEKFAKTSFAIKSIIGFLTGTFLGDEAYYFSSAKPDFINISNFGFASIKDTINSSYGIFTTNAYSFINYPDAKKYEQVLKYFPKEVFSKLVQELMLNNDFLRAVLTIIEANVLPLELQAGAYSITLETLTSFLCDKNSDTLKPIKDPIIEDELKKAFVDILSEFRDKDKINDEAYSILIKKNENINSPTNKDKLTKPFEILGYNLTEDESKILNSRNLFLHGKLPLKKNQDYKELYHISRRLHFLVCVLILKYVGFNGYLINYNFIHSHISNVKMDEEPFRLI